MQLLLTKARSGAQYDITHAVTKVEWSGSASQAARQLSIDYINAHGTSTHRNDLNEVIASKKIFGERAYKVPMSSNKSMTGHLLGGAGGMEAVATVLTIVNGIIPPTINYHEVDAEDGMDLDFVPNEARKQEVRAAMSSNFGFGGHNAVIVIRKYEA